MENFTTKTIREIALETPLTTRVFEELKIDYCCGGRKLFPDACREAGVDPEVAAGKIEAVLGTAGEVVAGPEFSSNPAGLVDHILSKHHTFTKFEIEQLRPLMDKVANRHGEAHAYLLELSRVVHSLFDDLLAHMHKEEAILFPYIMEMAAKSGAISVSSPPFGTVQNPIRMMMNEHDAAGAMLKAIRSLTDDFTLPEDACPSFTGLYSRLEDLERDLHQHIHLENNLLFPMAIEMEQEMYPLISA